MANRRKRVFWKGTIPVLFIILFIVSPVLISCSRGNSGVQPKAEPVPVMAAKAIRKTVPVQLRAIGNVEAYSTVSVKSQIEGVLTQVNFTEGQDVKKGDLLFVIDPRPYEAALKQAEANLARDMALMDNAREEARRYSELVRRGYVAQSQYDQVRTNAEALEATVQADKATVENARLRLSYCYIYAPITGRTGSLLANRGNLIKANADTPMVVIHQIRPVYVNFSVPENRLPEIKKFMTAGKLQIDVHTAQDETGPVRGLLSFIDNTVDIATGTIKLKGTFPNEERRLWPGQFVDVVMTLTSQPDSTVVPSEAVQTGQQGQFIFVVRPDFTVEAHPIVTGMAFDGEIVIEKGIQPGDTVVTDGQMRLVPGARVEIKNRDESGAPRGGTPRQSQKP